MSRIHSACAVQPACSRFVPVPPHTEERATPARAHFRPLPAGRAVYAARYLRARTSYYVVVFASMNGRGCVRAAPIQMECAAAIRRERPGSLATMPFKGSQGLNASLYGCAEARYCMFSMAREDAVPTPQHSFTKTHLANWRAPTESESFLLRFSGRWPGARRDRIRIPTCSWSLSVFPAADGLGSRPSSLSNGPCTA